MFHQDMFSNWDGVKEINIHLSGLKLYYNHAFLLQLYNFIYYAMPDYTGQIDTPLDYLNKYRPDPRHSFVEIEE